MKALLVSSAVLCILAFAAPASAEVTTNEVIPLQQTVFVPCANNGAGENVELTGQLHVLITFTINKNNVSGKVHFQPMGATGVGQTTGDKYQATGVTQDQFSGSLVNGKYEETFVNNFKIIGQGNNNNFLVHENFHITILQDGTVTVTHDNFSAECR